jgi:hypothetical protein
MAVTPLIKTPQEDGGTFYTFSSASRDLSKTFTNDNLRMVFSKFALLNIPDFDRLDINTFSNYQNYMQFDAIDGMILNGGLKSDPNVNWAESFQNYVLNFEELLLSNVDYDNSTKKSVAERVFFKWLKETGAIRFRQAADLEKSSISPITTFVEEDEKLTGDIQYRRVVKYIGDIDITNAVDKGGESYTELYINVPTEVGGTPTILFNSVSDNNYKPNLFVKGRSEYIAGRNVNSIHPQGLDIFAFYDYDQSLLGDGPGGYTDPNANWMNQSTPPSIIDAYFTEPSNSTEFLDSSNIDIRKYPEDYGSVPNFNGVSYRRNKLDGISLDFNANHYQQIAQDPTISTIQQFNGTDLSGTFEFNAVLVYYDLVDLSNQENTTTNLYGILLLDNIIPTTDGGYIQRYPKYKPNRVTGQNGNSYGFKINLRFDSDPSTSGVSTIINDYNTFSMGLFVDAVAQLQESVRIFQRHQLEISDIKQRLQSLENNIDAISLSTSLQSQITSLQRQLNNFSASMANGSTLLDLIAKNADDIQSLANGNVSTTLQYNTDILRPGPGIALNKNTPNQVRVDLLSQQYNLMVPFNENSVEVTSENPLDLSSSLPKVFASLQNFTNMLRINTINTAGGNLSIYIDDSSIQWKTGQVVRITFNNDLNIGSRNIIIYTDSNNRLNTGSYGVIAANISNNQISSLPIIELICIENGILRFVYDIIK